MGEFSKQRLQERNRFFGRLLAIAAVGVLSLLHPLSEGGGHFYHSGGNHWNSILDPEWQTLANWVCGKKANEKPAELPGWCSSGA